MYINNKYIIIVLKHPIHDSSNGELIKPLKAPTTPTKNLYTQCNLTQ